MIMRFEYLTGLGIDRFSRAWLEGSWDASGRYAENWSSVPMESFTAWDGCRAFQAEVRLDDSQADKRFAWGVRLEGLDGRRYWGIPTEVNDPETRTRVRSFVPEEGGGVERYILNLSRWLGANKEHRDGQDKPGIRFAVWAPNAQQIEVVFGDRESGYIADNGFGVAPNLANTEDPIGPLLLQKESGGIWGSRVEDEPLLEDFSLFDHQPYMFRVTKENGQVAYRTDLYSRCQIGSGKFDPQGNPFNGPYSELDGSKSCSVVIDPDTVTNHFREPVWPETEFMPAEEFWASEFSGGVSPPARVEDLVIYELHVGGIWNGSDRPGDLEDAIRLLDHIAELGCNAVELMPMNEFEGWASWGYGSSHYFAVEYSSGGRDQFKHFVRECHRRGLAVILDMVYNHYHHFAERAQWCYDADDPRNNIYYWYEGNPSDYPDPSGGYVDNMSTGYAPRYWEEMVRRTLISSAVALAVEFHVDGFRFDQTTSVHSYNRLHADGSEVSNANIFGAKFLREMTRTLKLVKPQVMLMAEDHSGWEMVTRPREEGGMGFEGVWYADFYHHLVGDARLDTSYARLLSVAGLGADGPLAMDYFAGALTASCNHKVVYHESHDEAGNSTVNIDGLEVLRSDRTINVAVNSAPLYGETRRWAEARTRFCAGITLLCAGTPMFFMGEEVGARKRYTYDAFMTAREDYAAMRRNEGENLFFFYRDLIRLRLDNSALRSHNLDVVHVHNDNRVLAFLRRETDQVFLVVGSLKNRPFDQGYWIRHNYLSGRWEEVFNSDSGIYGGFNIGNSGRVLEVQSDALNVIIPACGFTVFRKV